MNVDVIVTVVAGSLFVALAGGWGFSALISAMSPERRRLRHLATPGGVDISDGAFGLVDTVNPRIKRVPGVPKSPKEMGRLRRRLAMAGYTDVSAVVVFALAQLILPLVLVILTLWFAGMTRGFIFGIFAGAIGYMLP